MEHKGRYDRGYLPHCDFADSIQAITFRLADSVARELLDSWRMAVADNRASKETKSELLRKIARYEDAGHGACVLRRPECAAIVQEQLIASHGESYRLIEWCVMPNHVHVLIKINPGASLPVVVKGWKGSSAVRINRILNQNGALWMRDYFDRFIRDEDHFYNARIYIRENPVKAGLCKELEDWPFSSAGVAWRPDSQGR